MIDYYEILEVSRNASPDVIKAAYHILLARYDVDDFDHSKEIEHKVTTVKLAFDVLSDSEKRKDYDKTLHSLKHHSDRTQSAFHHSGDREGVSHRTDVNDSSLSGRLKWKKWGWSVSIVAVAAILISMVQPDPERAEREQLAAKRETQKDRTVLEAEAIKQTGDRPMPETVNSRSTQSSSSHNEP